MCSVNVSVCVLTFYLPLENYGFFRLDLIARHIFQRVNQPDDDAALISKVNM